MHSSIIYTSLEHLSPFNKDDIYHYQWELFEKALKKIGIHSTAHQQRILEIFYSRLALKICLKKKGIEILWRDLLSKNHFQLQTFLKIPLSLSHSQRQSLAVIADPLYISSIGCDIEYKDRKISSRIHKFISHSNDIEIPALEKWCLKEASYKCLSLMGEKLEFKNIKISQSSINTDNKHLKWEINMFNSHILAFSYLLTESSI